MRVSKHYEESEVLFPKSQLRYSIQYSEDRAVGDDNDYRPIFLGSEATQYGYFHIYLFYVGYAGFFHIGWCDGIFLREGGKRYEELDKHLHSSQFRLLIAFELIVCIVMALTGIFIDTNSDYTFITWMIIANILALMPLTMIEYFLQTTNRIKEYANITIVGRTVYCMGLALVILSGARDYKLFIISDLVGNVIALYYAIRMCRDIVFDKPTSIKRGVNETRINIKAGINLMFANIAAMLIIGIVRWGIQVQWDVATFGKISFTLCVSNLLLLFIRAVALVLYPTLRRMEAEKLPPLYGKLRNVLMIPLLGCLVLYYPIECILSIWLPQYADSMKYMAILFPLCIYSAKMTMLVQTYMKVFRMERQIMWVNVAGVILAIMTTGIAVFMMENLTLAIMSIVVNQAFSCIYAECLLAKKNDINEKKDILYELVMTSIFIAASWFVGGWTGVVLYALAYVLYLFIKRNEVKSLSSYVKELRK